MKTDRFDQLSASRKKNSLGDQMHYIQCLTELKTDQKAHLLLQCSSDIGVQRNLGRQGSAFGPQSILNQVKKLSHQKLKNNSLFYSYELINQAQQKISFEKSQDSIREDWIKINSFEKVSSVLLGGGHDHIYAMLMACEKQFKNINVVNIDPHFDARKDEFLHSGSPFYRFCQDSKIDSGRLNLVQLGIHPYANSMDTYTSINSEMIHVIEFDQAQKSLRTETEFETLKSKLRSCIQGNSKDTVLIISLDCDVIDGSQMQGVSAVNHCGFDLWSVQRLILWMQKEYSHMKNILGIFEYNPLFDNLSSHGARGIAHLLYHYFDNE
jgi:formiminoglutamase